MRGDVLSASQAAPFAAASGTHGSPVQVRQGPQHQPAPFPPAGTRKGFVNSPPAAAAVMMAGSRPGQLAPALLLQQRMPAVALNMPFPRQVPGAALSPMLCSRSLPWRRHCPSPEAASHTSVVGYRMAFHLMVHGL